MVDRHKRNNVRPGKVLKRMGRVPNVIIGGLKFCPHLKYFMFSGTITIVFYQHAVVVDDVNKSLI